MARTNFTDIRNTLNSLVDSIAKMHADLLREANEQREEALALHERMLNTQADIAEFGAMVGNVADQFAGIDEVAGDISMKISDAIYGGFADFPECDYEDFVGFCADCGCTIAEGDIFDYDGENFICEGCFHANDEAELDEDVLDEDEDVADETPVDEPVVETTENPVEA